MNILFLTPYYLNLYHPIEQELIKNGHHVIMIEDKNIRGDYRYEKNVFRKILKYFYCKCFGIHKKYWNQQLQNILLNEKIDVFFCINGMSFNKYLIRKLKCNNCYVKSILYLWDSLRFLNVRRNISFFDRVYSFDWEDSSRFGMMFLPFYWCNFGSQKEKDIDLFMYGSFFRERYDVAKKILPQLEKAKLNFYLKCVILVGKTAKDRYSYNLNELEKELIEFHNIEVEEYNDYLVRSKCVLDIGLPIQTGTTPRLIWALGNGCKVITTNPYIKRMPFYDEQYVSVIDIESPTIDVNFILGKSERNHSSFSTYLEGLRVDNWVERIISN